MTAMTTETLTTSRDAMSIISKKPATINVLVATFAGLGLPRTLSLPTKTDTAIRDVYFAILDRLPTVDESLILSTVSNKQLLSTNIEPISTLLSSAEDRLLSLRLSRRLCGGKGGFGSQLRAAGGRMSSRKNRDKQNQSANSAKTIDGRRLRTIDEAKRLAEYLAVKPDMDKREKDERKKRWQEVIASSEKREAEIKSGKAGSNQGRLNAQFVESKELAEEKTREAVLKAMREGTLELERTGSESSAEDVEGSDEDGAEESSGSSEDVQREQSRTGGSTTFFGWDDDEDEDDDEDDIEDEENEEDKQHGKSAQQASPTFEGKGKARAT